MTVLYELYKSNIRPMKGVVTHRGTFLPRFFS
ncbi:MAG: hypothetical protein RL274_1580 [Pseudomonadota bacterium]|jgi:hypothetical protein